jgi:hypothetical protein
MTQENVKKRVRQSPQTREKRVKFAPEAPSKENKCVAIDKTANFFLPELTTFPQQEKGSHYVVSS